MQGDPLSEQTMCFSNLKFQLVNAAEDPYITQFMIRNPSIPKSQLIPGTPQLLPFQQQNIKYVIQLKMPKDFMGEYDSYVQAFVDTFELCSIKNIECVTFTEPPPAIGRAKDFYAKIFFQAFQFYACQQINTKIKLIKIIHLDLQIVDIYMKELLQVVVISQKQSTDESNKNQIIETKVTQINKQEIQVEETKDIEDTTEQSEKVQELFDIQEYSRLTVQTLCEEVIEKLMNQ